MGASVSSPSDRRNGAGGAVGDELADAERALAAAGIDEPRREALVLWATLAECSPGRAWLERDRPAPPALVTRFRAAVRDRAAGVPTAYAAGHVAFRSIELEIDPRVLIPRPETEGLVDHVLAWGRARPPGRWGVAADIGTGSGCVAISLAVEGTFQRIIATDVSANALDVARANAARIAPAAPIEFRLGDLLWPLAGESVDVIVSNPPYVTVAEWEHLDPGVREHEPRVALVGGPSGLLQTEALLRGARRLLRPGGLLAIEVDCTRAELALTRARAIGWPCARVERDLFGRLRYLLVMKETE
jgi:release factor glutamine methyltransferase